MSEVLEEIEPGGDAVQLVEAISASQDASSGAAGVGRGVAVQPSSTNRWLQ